MMDLKFPQNRTINEEFDFWGVKGAGGVRSTPILKIRNSLLQNGENVPLQILAKSHHK